MAVSNINIPVADHVAFRRGGKKGLPESGVVFTCDPTLLRPSILAELIYHGLKQKVGDAANTADGDASKALSAMNAVWNSLMAGEWSTRTEAASDPIAHLRRRVREWVKSKLLPAEAAEYKALATTKDRAAYLDAKFEAQTETTRNKVIAVKQRQYEEDRELGLDDEPAEE